MSFKIIVGSNGAEGGADAMALAHRLAPPGAELVAVSVASVDGRASRGVNLDYDARIREDAQANVAEVRLENHDVLAEVREAHSVAAGLHLAVERHDADLLVIGSSRHGLIGRILSGDDVTSTLRGAPCPVAIAPRDYALGEGPLATVGVGWDTGPEAEQALDFARVVAEGLGARIHALNVVAVPPWPALDGTSTATEVDLAVQQAAAALDELHDVDTSTVAGVTADELVIFAAEVDVLVVGSHQRGPLGRIALGSASETLARRSARPIVVVPRAPKAVVSPA